MIVCKIIEKFCVQFDKFYLNTMDDINNCHIPCIFFLCYKTQTLVTFIATPSGKFLCKYSRKVSAVDPVNFKKSR